MILQFLWQILWSLQSVFHLYSQFYSIYRVFRWSQRSLEVHLLKILTEKISFWIVFIHIFPILSIALQVLS